MNKFTAWAEPTRAGHFLIRYYDGRMNHLLLRICDHNLKRLYKLGGKS